MGIETADGKQNFKVASILFFSELSSPSGILLKWSALHAIRRFRMQNDQKVTDYLLQQRQKLFEPFLQIAKG